MNQRIPPQNLEAERAVLGSMLVENSVIAEVVAILTPEDFYFRSYAKTYQTIIDLWNRAQAVDFISVDDALKSETDRLFAADLCALADSALPSHAMSHARLIKQAAERRRLIEKLTAATEDAYTEDPADIAARLSSFAASFSNGASSGFVHIAGVTVAAVKEIERAYQSRDPVTGIPTGLRDVDARLGGLHPGELVVVAGRPSMGKTALAVTVARSAAKRGHTVAFVTAESPAPKIVTRMLSEATKIENRNLRRGLLSDAEISTLTTESKRVATLSIYLLDSDRSWDRIRANIRSLKLKDPALALVLLDYVGLFHAPVPRGERHLEIGRISSEAKELAMELDLAVVLLSQLNREVESSSDKRPKLSHLRESGNLEQDADVVGLLFRPSYYDEPGPADLAQLDIAKNRDGATGVIPLRFNAETVSFSDCIRPTAARDFGEPRSA